MSDYFAHWLNVGRRIESSGQTLPGIFCVNWFRTDEHGKFVWPGFGENMRVLKWILQRVDGDASGVEHLFGVTPRYEDLSWEGTDFGRHEFGQITSVDAGVWRQELALHDELFAKLAYHLPAELIIVKDGIQKQLS